MFITGIPIAYHSARYAIDTDTPTRGRIRALRLYDHIVNLCEVHVHFLLPKDAASLKINVTKAY